MFEYKKFILLNIYESHTFNLFKLAINLCPTYVFYGICYPRCYFQPLTIFAKSSMIDSYVMGTLVVDGLIISFNHRNLFCYLTNFA